MISNTPERGHRRHAGVRAHRSRASDDLSTAFTSWVRIGIAIDSGNAARCQGGIEARV